MARSLSFRPFALGALVIVAMLAACSSDDDDAGSGPTSSSSSSSGDGTSSGAASSSSGGASSSSGEPVDGGASSGTVAGTGPKAPETFQKGVLVKYDGKDKAYNEEAKAKFDVNPNDGQNKYELRANLNTVGYSDMVLTIIADKTRLSPGFTAAQVDRVSIYLEHSQTPYQFIGDPASTSLTLVDTTLRLRGVAEGKPRTTAGPPKEAPFTRVEFDVEIPANANP